MTAYTNQCERTDTQCPGYTEGCLPSPQVDGLPWRLSAAASETGSSEDSNSILLGEEASLMHPIFEDADLEKSSRMGGEAVEETVSPALLACRE